MGLVSFRWLMMLVSFFYLLIVCMIRANLSLVIVAMVKRTQTQATMWSNTSDICSELHETHRSNTTHTMKGAKFEWDEQTQGFLLSAFYYGYLVTQVPGGRLAERVGPKKVLSVCILVSSLLTLLIPVAARLHYSALLTIRVVQGLFEGPVFPSIMYFIAKWIPPVERSRASTIVFNGCPLGFILCMWMSGTIIFYLGWEPIFYINGCLGVLVWIFWTLFVYDHPEEHPSISSKELEYIVKEFAKAKIVKQSLPVPVKDVLTSVPVWTIVACQVGTDWAQFCFGNVLPTYLNDILKFDIRSNGFVTGLPWLFHIIIGLLLSVLADKIRKNNWISELNTRKIYTVIALLCPAIFLASITFMGCQRYLITTMLLCAFGLTGATHSAHNLLLLVIAPNFSGTTAGISNGLGSVTGLIAPALVGYLTNNEPTLEQWDKVFWITAAIYTISCVQFLFLASAKVQSWNNPKEEPKNEP